MALDTTISLPIAAPERCCAPELPSQADVEGAERVAETAKALSDPIRVQVLDVLRRHSGEVCQCELTPLFDVSQPTLSHHLRKLHEAGLIEVERRGKWAYYSIRPQALEVIREWLS